jgi:hypothetical protein
MRGFSFTLVAGALYFAACGSDAPPNHKIACQKLDACRLDASGFSCDDERASACAQCINDQPCDDIFAGDCADVCPGVIIKPK